MPSPSISMSCLLLKAHGTEIWRVWFSEMGISSVYKERKLFINNLLCLFLERVMYSDSGLPRDRLYILFALRFVLCCLVWASGLNEREYCLSIFLAGGLGGMGLFSSVHSRHIYLREEYQLSTSLVPAYSVSAGVCLVPASSGIPVLQTWTVLRPWQAIQVLLTYS